MSLGSLIATARNDAGLSLEDLAATTNIRIIVLREIEKDNFANCGGETYARGHLRNIAKALNADQKEFIRLFEEEQGGETRSMRELLVENSVIRQSTESHKISWKVLVMISVISLFIVGIAQIIISNTKTDTNIVAEPTPSISASPSQTPTVSESPTAEPSAQSTFTTGTGVQVTIEAVRAKSWIFVSDADGRTLFSGVVLRGEAKVFTTETKLNLRVGNAGGIDLTVNGNKVAAIGASGEVVSVSYGVDS